MKHMTFASLVIIAFIPSVTIAEPMCRSAISLSTRSSATMPVEMRAVGSTDALGGPVGKIYGANTLGGVLGPSTSAMSTTDSA